MNAPEGNQGSPEEIADAEGRMYAAEEVLSRLRSKMTPEQLELAKESRLYFSGTRILGTSKGHEIRALDKDEGVVDGLELKAEEAARLYSVLLPIANYQENEESLSEAANLQRHDDELSVQRSAIMKDILGE